MDQVIMVLGCWVFLFIISPSIQWVVIKKHINDSKSLKIKLEREERASEQYRCWWLEDAAKASRRERLLDEANEIIRKANARINELKSNASIESQYSPEKLFALPEGFTAQDVRKKYKLLSVYHPDKGGTHEQMTRVKNAYDQLISNVGLHS